MTPYPTVVIDIETYGRRPDAVILSIGAVYVDLINGSTGRKMHVNVDPDECDLYGLTTDDETIRWWKNQSKAARARTLDPTTRVSLREAMTGLTEFIDITCRLGSSYEIYTCGPQFDIVILETCYRVLGLKEPWPFWSIRDYRTLREWFPNVKPPVKNAGAHDALNDAIYEAEHLIAIYNHVKSLSKLQLLVDSSTGNEL